MVQNQDYFRTDVGYYTAIIDNLGESLENELRYTGAAYLSLHVNTEQNDRGVHTGSSGMIVLDNVIYDHFLSIQIVFTGTIEEGTFITIEEPDYSRTYIGRLGNRFDYIDQDIEISSDAET